MEDSQKGVRPLIRFQRGNLTIKEVAAALQMDKQTIRTLIRNGNVQWGQAVRMPGSSRFTYLISPLKFYESTGCLVGAELDEYQIWEDLQGRFPGDKDFFHYAELRKQSVDEKLDQERR